jgi:uncharacterized protein (DUF58 family)
LRPGAPLINLAITWLGLGLVTAFVPSLSTVGLAFGGIVGAIALVELLLPGWRRPVIVERDAPETYALGVWTDVSMRVRADGGRSRKLWLFDGTPSTSEVEGQPAYITVPDEGWVDLVYRILMRRRGEVEFGDVHVLHRSPLGLWCFARKIDIPQDARVFPNFAPVVRFSLLAVENRLEQMGIKRRSMQGMGKSFHQLREYRDGDLLTQVDWKATSRQRKLISREYQEERDQQILILLDCGRRMRSEDGEITFFDHALNASLLLTYVALEQGDGVGVMTFSGSDKWLPALRGRGAMPQVLQHLHDLHPTEAPSDYEEAATRILTRQKRRAMIVLITNLRDEDDQELNLAVQTLRGRHLVVVASLREPVIEENLTNPVKTLDDAILAGSSALYLESRAEGIASLRGRNVSALDLRAEDLPVALTNEYLALKDAGKL